MKSYTKLNSEISNAIIYGESLQNLKDEYSAELKRIEMFTAMFLEKYSERLVGDRKDSPEWKLYNAKTEAYSNYSRAIRQIDYFIAKEKYATA